MGKLPKIFLCLLLCCSLLCGCSFMSEPLAPIVINEMDLTMTLPGYFENMLNEEVMTDDMEGFFAYGFSEISISGLRDDYEVFDKVPTLEEYAKELIAKSEYTAEVEIIDGMTTFTYRHLNKSESYTSMTAVFAGTESFWMITATCRTINFDSARDKLVEILKTAQVA